MEHEQSRSFVACVVHYRHCKNTEDSFASDVLYMYKHVYRITGKAVSLSSSCKEATLLL